MGWGGGGGGVGQALEVSHPGVSKSFLGHGKMGKMGKMGENGGKWGETGEAGENGGKRGGNGGKCGGMGCQSTLARHCYFFDDTHECNTSIQ